MNLEEEPEGDEDCIDKIHEIEMKNVEFRYPQRSESAVKNIAYPINRAAREMLYSAVLQEYDRLRSEEELRRQETKLQVS